MRKYFRASLQACPMYSTLLIVATLARKNQNFFHARIGDNLHLALDLLHGQLHTLDMVITVETTVNAVVFTVIGNIERRKQIDRVAEMLCWFPYEPAGPSAPETDSAAGESSALKSSMRARFHAAKRHATSFAVYPVES